MSKPKGKTPSLISGKTPKRITIKRYVKCNRCKNKIYAGEDCFGIPNIRIKYISSYKKFCKACFDNILAKTEQDLQAARNL